MDKLLVDTIGDITITNDGATILNELDVGHPAAKMMVEVAKAQDDEVGDGTTSAVVIAGELLTKAEKLLDDRIHPTIIIRGFKHAAERAIEILNDIAETIEIENLSRLKEVALTSMHGKGIEVAKDRFAEIAMDAVKHIVERSDGSQKVDINHIKIVKEEGKSLIIE